jgi:phosphohistidine phosphatase
MDLLLWRHAEAEYGPPDMERALTPKGRRQAQKMGQWLARKLPESCRILVSPARRALQTADALGRPYKVVPEIAPDASAAQVLLACQWPQRKEPVLIVGHQPTLGQVAALLLSGNEQDWHIRKANVWWISQRGQDEESGTHLKLALGPDLVSK